MKPKDNLITYCTKCGNEITARDMDKSWCNNCLRKHLDDTPREDKEIKQPRTI